MTLYCSCCERPYEENRGREIIAELRDWLDTLIVNDMGDLSDPRTPRWSTIHSSFPKLLTGRTFREVRLMSNEDLQEIHGIGPVFSQVTEEAVERTWTNALDLHGFRLVSQRP